MTLGKYLTRILANPGLLIFEEKHGTRYFYCRNPEEYCKAAMKVLKQRLEEGYWYGNDSEDEELMSVIEAHKYAGAIYRGPRLENAKAQAEAIVAANDLGLAYQFMEMRATGEYELMSREHVESLEEEED